MASTLTRGLVPSIAAIEILQAGGFGFRVDAMRADQETDRPPATKVGNHRRRRASSQGNA